ncbi:hypothetical protein INT48_007883 [Thamnidium elegans]|uniref:Uncharacterized protein n=1 Tax=Thamnidium elegans TaxID=101142 RepID=A0A8H7SVY8_9FUNG|nr:hypothetical protein INT48_007883 [Thamnidium elegans]
MFKSRRKRQQQKLAEAEATAAAAAAAASEADLVDTSKYTLLDDIHLTHDFRSSVILPQLNKDLDAKKLSTQQQHLEQLRESNESPLSPPLSPPPQDLDGTKQYQELAAWRHQRSQNRYSNGLFGGKQRGRPKPKKFVSREDIHEEKEDSEEEEQVEKIKEVTTTSDLPTMIQEQEFDFSDDEEPMKEMYEPDSDTEENFFFQDFSADSKSTKNKNQTRQRANKALSRFDLSSFARDLHDHRLSVIQPRDSKIIMTEDDELELEKLLERQRQRMSMMTMVTDSNESLPAPPPPMPALDIIKAHQKPTNEVIIKKKLPIVEKIPIVKQEHTPIKKVDLVQQAPLRPSVSSSSSMLAPKIDQLKRSVSTTSIKSNTPQVLPSVSSQLRPNAPSIRIPSKLNARKSCSMDNIQVKIDENEPSVTSAALDWISEDSSQNPTSFLYKKAIPVKQPPAPPAIKSRGLFGSLRQVSRSKTHSGNGVNSIKGLVRNFSSSHKPVDRDAGMSRAAMAVLQHNASKQETTAAPEPTIEPRKSRSRTKSDANIISNLISRASSNRKNNNATKIVNMEDEAKKRAQVVRRTIIYVQPDSLHDMLKNGGNVPPMPSKSSTRNTVLSESSLSPDDETVRSKEYVTATKIVRQTSVRKRVVEDTVTAEHTPSPLAESNLGLLSRNGSRRRYQLKSVHENEFAKSDLKHTSDSSGSSTENSDYLEGVELREMSDGSVVWGLVKKEGNRKSFFAPNKHNEYEQVEEEEEEEVVVKRRPTMSTSSSLSPPPIPKRSPRRQETTDVYYSKQMTLPSLLKMMQDQHPGDDDDESEDEENYEVKRRAMASVDDQLDEMMRILTSPQQH